LVKDLVNLPTEQPIGIASIVSSGGMTVVGQADTGGEAVRVHLQLSPDVTLMDLRLPDMSRVDAIRQIRALSPSAKFVVLTNYEGDEDMHQALDAGAGGYLIKGMSHDILLKALNHVHRGDRLSSTRRHRSPAIPGAKFAFKRSRTSSTLFNVSREKQSGDPEELVIKEATVKSYVSVILMRLNVSDRTQAVVEGLNAASSISRNIPLDKFSPFRHSPLLMTHQGLSINILHRCLSSDN
jgi:DNA-binding NarL/FixJ family response regulator